MNHRLIFVMIGLALSVLVCGLVLAFAPPRALQATQPVYLRVNQVGDLPNESNKHPFAVPQASPLHPAQ